MGAGGKRKGVHEQDMPFEVKISESQKFRLPPMQTFPWPHPAMAPASYHTAGALPDFGPSLLSLVLRPSPQDMELSEETRNHSSILCMEEVFFFLYAV